MAPICGTSPELYQYSNPNLTSYLTYHPDKCAITHNTHHYRVV